MELNYLAAHRLVVECVNLCVHRQGNDPLETDRNKTSIFFFAVAIIHFIELANWERYRKLLGFSCSYFSSYSSYSSGSSPLSDVINFPPGKENRT